MYYQEPENTLKSLQHAISLFDGIEFDIRMTSDNQLVIHHDRGVSIPKSRLQGKSKWVESWKLSDLESEGFLSFRAMLEDPIINTNWVEKGKMGCIEIKRPHPTAPMGGGFFSRKKHNKHIANIIKMADEILDEFQVPHENMVYYAFHKGMRESSNMAKSKRPWAALIPYISPYGNRTTQRIQSFPRYLSTSFSSLVKQHNQMGSSMLPCAIEYFVAPHNKIPLGKTIGLHGKELQDMNKIRKGLSTYVWPAKPIHERLILNAGLTGLTDKANPELTWLPTGHARWLNPATQPLDNQQLQLLNSATEENHLEILRQLKQEVPLWSECDNSRRIELISMWKESWNWQKSVDEILQSASKSSPPWQAPRLIGHRGSGKTPRPVISE
jgi:glycerophosphoryl diester phosphodiesterase